MIISFSGDGGSGKSTIAKKVAQEIGYPRYYMGQILRDMAAEKGISLVELLKLAQEDEKIDKELDAHVVTLAQKEKDFIIESRTAWHFIPESLKIYLAVSPEEGARRIWSELAGENQRNESKNLQTQEDVLASNRERKESDKIRYQKYYGIDVYDMNNYDFVVDTSNLSVEEVYEQVLEYIKKQLKK